MTSKSTFSLENLRLPFEYVQDSHFKTNNIFHPEQQSDWFIKGPIPGSWILKAADLTGNFTIRVALVIWYVQGMSGKNGILLERYHFDKFNIKKDSARRALQRLQKAGLIDYEKVGHKFKVTILGDDSY